jgi:hypothetical protein
LEYVRAHPNASQRAVRDAVRARGHAVDSTVARLLRAGVLIDMGSDARHRYRVRDAVPPELFAARARRAMRADRTAAARRIARWLAEQVRQVAPPGLGYWPDAWQLVDAPSGAFLDALADWQASGSAADQQRAQTTAAAVLAAWRAAAEQWAAAGRPLGRDAAGAAA